MLVRRSPALLLGIVAALLARTSEAFSGPYCPAGVQASQMVRDAQLSASSGNATLGRLYGVSAWTADNIGTEYLQIDLGQPLLVTGFATQGQGSAWVTNVTVSVSLDNATFTSLGSFTANTEATSVVSTLFNLSNATGNATASITDVSLTGTHTMVNIAMNMTARYVRFTPVDGSSSGVPAPLRVELYTPCVFAEFFGWQAANLGVNSVNYTAAAGWSLVPATTLTGPPNVANIVLTSPTNGLVATQLITGSPATNGVAYVPNQSLDLSNYLWANATAYLRITAANLPVVTLSVTSTPTAANVNISSLPSSITASLPLQPSVTPFFRFRRIAGSSLNGAVELQAIWIAGVSKTCAQIAGIVVDPVSGVCRTCDGVLEYQDVAGQTACKNVTSCSSGQYETQAPTASSNRQCTSCTTSCSGATFLTGICGGTSTPVCAPCLPGCFTCNTNATCIHCEASKFLAVDQTACLESCPSRLSTSDSNDFQYCQACTAPCVTCQDDPSFCRTCESTQFLDDHRAGAPNFISLCANPCPASYYGSLATRVCTAVRSCPFPPLYELAAPGVTSDRVCANITGCPFGNFQSQAPTPTSNRMCAPCPAGTIDHDNNYNTSCMACPAGTYTPEGTALPSCPVCPAGTTDDDFNASTPCVLCSAAGLYVPPNSTGQCSLYTCELGTIDEDLDSSTPCIRCANGTDLSTRGLSGSCSDRLCAKGTTDNDYNPATACRRCPAGSYVPLGQAGSCDPFVCLNGTIDGDSDPATECISCTGAGLFVPVNSSGNCRSFPCLPGSIDDDFNSSTACVSCPAGTDLSIAGRSGPCSAYPCPAGTTDLDSDPASGCSVCGPGVYVPPGSAGDCSLYRCLVGSSDVDSNASTVCVNCTQPGLYVPLGSSGSCSLFPCAIGTIDSDNNSATVCATCEPGADLSTPGMFGSCASRFCLAGTIDLDSNTSSPCRACPRGSYVPPGMAGSCDPFVCLNGNIDDDNSSATPCVGCLGVGLFVPRNSSGVCSNFQCSAGTLDDDRNSSTVCVQCSPGTDLSSAGRSGNCSSFLCPFGTIDGDSNPTTACTWCPPGAFVPRGRSGSCEAFVCDFGLVDRDVNASTPCELCTAPGLFVPRNSSGNCNTYTCDVGSIDDDSNSSTVCISCPAGTDLSSRGLSGPCVNRNCAAGTSDIDNQPATACVGCPAGTFVPTGSAGACNLYQCIIGTSDTDNLSSTDCEPCIQAGLFVPVASAGACSLYPCAINTTDEDSNSATLCITCLPGTDLSTTGLSGACNTHRCNAGTIDGDLDPATACTACGVGTYVPPGSSGLCSTFNCAAGSVDADEQSATPCADCTLGTTYQPNGGQTTCTSCTVLCAGGTAGLYVSRQCNRTDDITCSNCTLCGSSGYQSVCTNFTDAVCAAASSSSAVGGLAVAAGAAGGGLLILLLLIVLVIYVKKKKQTGPQRIPTENQMILPRTESLLPDMKLFEPRGRAATDAPPQTYVVLKDMPTVSVKQPALYALPQSESDVDFDTTQETALSATTLASFASGSKGAPAPAVAAVDPATLYTAVKKGKSSKREPSNAPAQPLYAAVGQDGESIYASAEKGQDQDLGLASGELLGPDGRPLYTAVNKQPHYDVQPGSFYAPLAEVQPARPHPDGLIYSALDLRLPGAATSPPPGSDDHVVYSALDLRASGLHPQARAAVGKMS